jgi:hypothetical protein
MLDAGIPKQATPSMQLFTPPLKQGEAGQFPSPRWLDQAQSPIGQSHTRHTHLQLAGILEELQMLIDVGHRVAGRVLAFHAISRETTTRTEVDLHRQETISSLDLLNRFTYQGSLIPEAFANSSSDTMAELR